MILPPEKASGCRCRRLDRGFTVVEFLAATVILIILAALLLPGLNSVRTRTDATKCLGKMRNLGVAAHLFINENNNFLPYRSDDPNWMFNMAPYLGVIPLKKAGNEPMTSIFLCPADPSTAPRQRRTYRFQQTFPSLEGSPAYGRANYVPSRFREIVSPATHAMILCIAYKGPRALDLWRYDEAIWKKSADESYPPGNTEVMSRPHYDNKAMNILFSDGHVGKLAYPLPRETWHLDGKWKFF